MSDPDHTGVYVATIVAAIIGAVGVLGAALIGNWDKITSESDTPVAATEQSAADQATSGSVAPSQRSTSPNEPLDRTAETLAPDTSSCSIAVDHIGAAIHAESRFDSRRIVSVPEGDYSALGWEESEWAGTTSIWFLINVNGREGWIADDGISIVGKTATCP
ncbi:MAG: hypothetical protein HKN03_02265 [Acidimicrobiales bacterium]|nr:hypothetical protein [Acidimicrobiales bacterium]